MHNNKYNHNKQQSYPPRTEQQNENGYVKREGGYPPKREGYIPRDGPRDGSREGGYPPKREGYFPRDGSRDGPRYGQRNESREGGYPQKREGYFPKDGARDGQRENRYPPRDNEFSHHQKQFLNEKVDGEEHEDVETVSIPFNENNVLIKNEDVERLFKKFDIEFKVQNIELYRKALTHKSYIKREYYGLYKDILDEAVKLYGKNTLPLQEASNERFEFLGDTVIKLICADYLFDRFNEDTDDEGFLSRLKMKIENREALCVFAKELGIDKYMIISNQVEALQGRDSDKLLEDVFESFMGALYKDQGFQVCYTFMRILLETIPDFSELIYKDTNFKNQIMIFYHKNKWAAPKYVDMEQFIDKKTGKKMFKEGILDYTGKVLCEGVATTKKAAQQMAAMHALLKFNLLNDDQIVAEFE
jgi:dsRNA-specific ribonuclease